MGIVRLVLRQAKSLHKIDRLKSKLRDLRMKHRRIDVPAVMRRRLFLQVLVPMRSEFHRAEGVASRDSFDEGKKGALLLRRDRMQEESCVQRAGFVEIDQTFHGASRRRDMLVVPIG